tara:strand:+ start:170 stop:2002 length:1833 start_codon:yes stop_codon:yes gene_type:complete
MSKKILLTLIHDFSIFSISFFLALWIRLDFDLTYNLMSSLWVFSIFFSISNIIILKYFGLYLGIWRYASINEMLSIIKSLSISTLLLITLLFLIFRLENVPRSFPILLFIIALFGVTAPRFIYRTLKDRISKRYFPGIPIYLAGNIESVENFIRLTKAQKSSPYEVIGIIANNSESIRSTIHNVPIVGSLHNIEGLELHLKKNLEKKLSIPQRIIVTDHSTKQNDIEALYIFSKKNGLAIGELPRLSGLKSTDNNSFHTTPIVIEDVLGRKQKVQNPIFLKDISNKVVLVTGAGGSIGSELCNQIYSLKPKLLIMFEQNEFNLYKISQKYKKNTLSILGDIRDIEKVEMIIKDYKPDLIYHSAALKHITFVETDPLEALKTNFWATVKLCELCKLYKIKKFVFISTDKAVNPTNIMGASKRLCEKYIQRSSKNSLTFFSIVRFGNVLGSTGSVVPLFQDQIIKGGPITITHPDVKRYFMTIREAVELVLTASQLKNRFNGEILILEMGEPVLIKDLANKMILLLGKSKNEIDFSFTGLRKGEKLNEELFFKEEKTNKTEVEGILSTQDNLFQSEIKDYNKLILHIQKNNISQALKLFKTMLPEYRLNEKT